MFYGTRVCLDNFYTVYWFTPNFYFFITGTGEFYFSSNYFKKINHDLAYTNEWKIAAAYRYCNPTKQT